MTEISDLNEVDASNASPLISGYSIDGNIANMATTDNVFQAFAGMLKRWFRADRFRLRDSTDQTKLLAFNLSALSSGTTTIEPQKKIQVIRRQIFTTSGTYTPHASMTYVMVESIGGGGGGGGVIGSATAGAAGGGGGAGAYTRSLLARAAVLPSVAVTIGAGGTGSSGAAGTNGGNTTFGALNTALGGGGGGVGNATTGGAGAAGSGGALSGTGSELYGGSGGSPGYATGTGVSVIQPGGSGGASILGGAGRGLYGATGGASSAPGSGGGGAGLLNIASNYAGGGGNAGIVIVTEYCTE